MLAGFTAPATAGQGFDQAVEMLLSPSGSFKCNDPEFNLRVQPTFSDKYARFFASGVLAMPAPAFGYTLEQTHHKFDDRAYTLYLIEPDKPWDDLITDLPIEFDFIAEKDLENFTIKLHSAPDSVLYEKIDCERQN